MLFRSWVPKEWKEEKFKEMLVGRTQYIEALRLTGIQVQNFEVKDFEKLVDVGLKDMNRFYIEKTHIDFKEKQFLREILDLREKIEVYCIDGILIIKTNAKSELFKTN